MTSDAMEGTRILGSLGTAGSRGVVRMEDTFDTRIEDLWSALTDPRRVARWLGEVEGDLQPGGAFRARFFASGWEGTGQIDACEPPKRLLLRTTDSESREEHTIEAWLSPAEDQTVLVVEERGMPVEQLPGYGAGIQIHFEDLAASLAGRDRVGAGRWQELMPLYSDLAARNVGEAR